MEIVNMLLCLPCLGFPIVRCWVQLVATILLCVTKNGQEWSQADSDTTFVEF